MPIAEARYDFQLFIGHQAHQFRVVMHEEREMDISGMPEKLVSAKLASYQSIHKARRSHTSACRSLDRPASTFW